MKSIARFARVVFIFVHFAAVLSLGPFLESPENFSRPESQLSNCNLLPFEKVILSLMHKKTKRISKFDGLEPRRCKDIKGIVAPEIGPKGCGTFEKQATGREMTCFECSCVDNVSVGRQVLTFVFHLQSLNQKCQTTWENSVAESFSYIQFSDVLLNSRRVFVVS